MHLSIVIVVVMREQGIRCDHMINIQAVQRAVDIAEGGRSARPVSDAEASKGRLDYVRVRSSAPNP
jgi:hypothetical protein